MVDRRGYIKGVAGISTLAVAGCTSQNEGDGGDGGNGGDGGGGTNQDTGDEIVVGASMSLSGNFSTNAIHVGNAYRLWEKLVNDNGGIDGRPVRLEMQDDQSKTENAVKAVQRVIEQEDADAILGPYSSGVSAAVMGVVEEFGVPMIAPMASSPSIFSADNDWSFMGYPMAGTSWGPDADLLAENGASKVAILRTDVAVHELEAEGAKEELDAKGIDHRTWTNQFGAEDLSTQVSEMAGYDPDSIYLITYGGTTLAALRELINQDVDPDHITGVTTGGETLQDTIGGNINGIFGHSPWSTDIETEQATTLVDAYVSEFAMQPTFHFALGYSSAQAYQMAVERAGSAEKAAVRDYLANNAMEGTLTGTFEVNDQRRQVGYDWLTTQWQGGTKEILLPEAKATTDELVWPKPNWGV